MVCKFAVRDKRDIVPPCSFGRSGISPSMCSYGTTADGTTRAANRWASCPNAMRARRIIEDMIEAEARPCRPDVFARLWSRA
jgi:hypothetical protein